MPQLATVTPTVANDDLLTAWLASIIARTADDYDENIVVTGYTGNGKSSAVWWLGHALDQMASEMLGHARSFSHERLCLTSTEMHEQLQLVGKAEVVALDEGVEGLYSRESMTAQNRDIVKWLDVCRARNAILIACMANLRWIDARVAHDRARWVVHIPARGEAVVYKAVRPIGLDPEANTRWRPVFKFLFPKPYGADYDQYRARKFQRVSNYDPGKERIERRSTRRRRRRSED